MFDIGTRSRHGRVILTSNSVLLPDTDSELDQNGSGRLKLGTGSGNGRVILAYNSFLLVPTDSEPDLNEFGLYHRSRSPIVYH